MLYALLPQRGLLHLSGEDLFPFLQGLFTNDVTRLPTYAALLTPQGKFLHDFFLVSDKDGILLDVDKSRLPDLLQRLKMYKLRSKVTMEIMPETFGVAVVWGSGFKVQDSGVKAFVDPRFSELGWRLVGDMNAIKTACAKMESADYERMRISLGVPEDGSDLVPEKSFPLHFGFEDLHGVDFKKGCYVGQEVTARTKHLGEIRKFIYQVKSHSALPPTGTPVFAGDANIGELRSVSGEIGLALLKVEDAKKPLRAGDIEITASLPSWVKSFQQ